MSTAADPALVHEGTGLHRLGGRPTLPRYLQQFWARRFFTFELARSRFRAENEQDRLGIAWVVVRPLLNAAVYGTVFGILLPSSTRPPNFLAFLVTGIFFFQFFANCLSEGARSITGNLGLVRTLQFPRALLPFATVLQQAFAMVPMVVVLMALVLLTGEPLSLRWLQIAPVLVLMTLFNTGVALVTARATIHIRDIAQLLPFLTRILFYVSGIFYAIDKTIKNEPARIVLQLNPVHDYIALARGALIEGQPANTHFWIYGVGWAVVAATGGFLFFWHAEERYGRQ